MRTDRRTGKVLPVRKQRAESQKTPISGRDWR